MACWRRAARLPQGQAPQPLQERPCVRAPDRRVHRPDYWLYLDRSWQPPWTCDHLDWPDVGVPDHPVRALAALRFLCPRAVETAAQEAFVASFGT